MEEESGFFNGVDVVPDDANGMTGMTLMYESPSGAFHIYKARHAGRRVVIKTPGASRLNDPLLITQLRKEFELGFAVDHPSVCRTLAFLTLSDSHPAIELEYCDGLNLRQVIDRYNNSSTDADAIDRDYANCGVALPAGETLDAFILNLLDGLEAIHNSGIVHRDIKPSNIIYDPVRSTVKIIDFGCADSTDHLLLKAPAGTARYTRHSSDVSTLPPLPADDLYSLGMTLLELSVVLTSSTDRKRLENFSRKLINADFTSAKAARKGWIELSKNRKRNLYLLAGCAVSLVLTFSGILLSYFKPTKPTVIDSSAGTTTSDSLHNPSELVANPEGISIYAASSLSSSSSEETSPSSTVSTEKSTRNLFSNEDESRLSPEAKSSANPSEIITPVTSNLYDEAIAAGPLLQKYKTGKISSAERADAIAISLADSIYYKVWKNDLVKAGWPHFSAQEIDRLTEEKVSKYLPELRKSLSAPGVDSKDFQRQRNLFRHRLHFILSSYHLSKE